MTRIASKIALAAVTCGMLSAPVFAATPVAQSVKPDEPKQCYDLGNMRSRMVIEPDSLLIEDAFGKYVLLKLTAPCRHIDELDKIGFEFNGSTQLCRKTDVKILHSRNTEAPLRCLIDTMTPLTKDEAKVYMTPKPKEK
ncbi:DUF6491 family protein [Asticcacaulis machinosus]|uniref:DUF6491 family protein n=1 Tax=Asticcacaulis machinosus TaxID=2984211 RepID=A0ABT5HHC3_9CAUL|nr:DUF6491 family protein [Asticcacaulis machinosus]MDC7675646.1 DUF6491 family protein [Asticcacaulis machinosus]